MGKPKKGKKGHDQDDLSDEEFSSSTGAGTKMGDNESDLTNQAATKKMKKGKKSRKDDDLEDIEAEIAAMSLEMNKDSKNATEEEDVHVVSKKKKKEKKRVEDDAVEMESPAVARFQLLGLMDNEDEDEVVDNSDGKESEDEKAKGGEVVLESVGNTDASHGKKEKKKKKGKEKGKTAEEEDVDAILAELNEPSEKRKGKKGKQKDTKEEVEQETQDEPQTVAIEVKKLDPKVVTIDDFESDEDSKKKKKKTGKREVKEDETGALEGDEEEDEDGGTVKTAAQKKKEKKERERLKKLQQKQKQQKKDAVTAEDDKVKSSKQEVTTTVDTEQNEGEKAVAEVDSEEEGEKEAKKKKKKKGEKEEKPKTNKRVAAIKEHLAKVKEEEERKRREEEEAEKLEQERIHKLEEQKRLEEERRLKKKLKKKEREERAKKEGRFLTEKQKQDRMRLNQMLEIMREQGVGIPSKEEAAKKKPLYTKKKKEAQPKDDTAKPLSPSEEKTLEISSPVSEENKLDKLEESSVTDVKHDQEENEATEVKDAWDEESQEEDSSEEEEEEEETGDKPEDTVVSEAVDARQSTAPAEENNEESEGEEEESEEESETEEASSETESDDDRTPAERGKEKVRKRHEAAEKKRTTEVLRAPVVCVLGHVDTGKTKILDKLRRTNVQEGEAGGITQQIGATNVPKDAILEKTKMCKEFMKQDLKLPGLLIIDTPGHESFSNLRSRGSSLCDIAVLVIDIMHGLEPQTIESINLLKQRKTPFVVALNKIDRLYQWKSNPQADVYNTIKRQTPHTKSEFDERARSVITQLAQEGLNAALFYENKNVKEYVSLVPTSAHSGDGMGNLVALICELTQSLLAKRLSYSEELQATVMEVKALPGLGTTIDVVLVNGRLCEGTTMVLAGTEGPIVTPIRGLLMPQPMKELRVKNQYEHHKEVLAAQGVKIIAKDLEKTLAGLPLYISHDQDEIEYYKQEVEKALEDALKSIRLSDRGVFVQASTLGSLEALLEFLRTSKVKYAGINIGPVHKKDIMKASIMLEHDPQYAVILAFDVRVEREAQELADHLGVKIFTADIIYHLFDKFTAYREELIKKKQEEFRHIAVFPCKLRILPQFVFNSRDPIVIGVQVEAGFLKEGTPLCVPSKEFVEIGRVASIEFNHKPVEIGRQGQEVCIKIVPIPGEAPKMYGRHFEETDLLISKISRESIDAVKEHFRKEMSKTDWMLVMELKKLFQIL